MCVTSEYREVKVGHNWLWSLTASRKTPALPVLDLEQVISPLLCFIYKAGPMIVHTSWSLEMVA